MLLNKASLITKVLGRRTLLTILRQSNAYFHMSSIVPASSNSGEFRVERDTFGELKVPADCYYGAQTAR